MKALGILMMAALATAGAQDKPKKPARGDTTLAARMIRDSLDRIKLAKLPHDSMKVSTLYQSETPLAISLTTNIKRIRGDKDANAPYRWATISYTDSGKTVTIPTRVRTRGIWRLKTCEFP